MKKRFLSILLCACMVLTLLPAVSITASATGTGAIQLGTGSITAGDEVYFGNCTESSTTYNVPWLVVGSNGSIKSTLDTSPTSLFLLSEYMLGNSPFQSSGSGYYSGSTLQTAMSGIYSGFTTQEQGAVLETTLTGASMFDGQSELSSQKLFPLSDDEANSIGTDTLKAKYITDTTGSGGWWWLRSFYSGNDAYCFSDGGFFTYDGVGNSHGVRPALNLNLSSVLFASAAEGGKSSGAVGAAALNLVSTATPSAWKLTLEDNSRSFAASTTAIDTDNSTVTIAYSGATVGTNEYISAIIKDNGDNIKYYGRIAQPTAANGTATIDLSGVTMAATDTLYVFSEQANGDDKTDYASALQTVSTSGHEVTYSLSNLTTSGGTYVEDAANYTATLSTGTGYLLPSAISVTVGGTAATLTTSADDADAAGEYFYDASTGEIKVAAVSGAVVITAAGVAMTYTISTSPSSIDFGSLTVGYTAAPAAQAVTITNDGNSDVTDYTVTGGGTDFDVTYTSAAISAGGTSTFTVQPVTGLAAASHTATLTVTTSENTIATVDLSFTVTEASSSEGGSSVTRYTITASAGTGGAISPSGSTSVASGNDKTYTITADDGYEIEDVLVDGESIGAVSSYTFDNVKKAHTITALFTETEEEIVNPFADVNTNDWFYENVMFVYENGLFAGTSDTTFSPDASMTRQMIWMVLARMNGKTPADMDEARAWAMENGISDGSNPTNVITREQLAVILYRYAQYKGYDTTQGGMAVREYADYDAISDYALEAMAWTVNAGLMQGSNNNIMPTGTITRAQVATILQRFCQNVAK